MGMLTQLLSFTMPLIAGVLLAAAFFRSPLRRLDLLVTGYGILIGLLLAPVILRLLDAAGLPLSSVPFAVAAALLALGAYGVFWRSVRTTTIATGVSGNERTSSRPEQLVLLVFGILTAIHLALIGYEVIMRPLFPFDATMHWATKARVWFEHAQIVPFVETQEWLDLGGAGVYTDHHPAYPPTIPLLQVWMSLVLGRWDESLINLPWWILAVSLAFSFFGQARAVGVGAVTASVFTYFLMSIPLLNTHVALAGYADLFLGATYASALMSLHRWQQVREPKHLVLAIVLALLCTQIKNEGLFWAATLVPAVLFVLMPSRWIIRGAVSGMVAMIALLVLWPHDLIVAGHSLEQLRLGIRMESLPALGRMLVGFESWHLMGYLLLLLPFGMLAIRKQLGNHSALAVALASAVLLFVVLFVFTKYSGGAIRQSAAGRIGLHLTPGLMFLAMLVWHSFLVSRGVASSDDAVATKSSSARDSENGSSRI